MIPNAMHPSRNRFRPACALALALAGCAGPGAGSHGAFITVAPAEAAAIRVPAGVPTARARFVGGSPIRVDGRADDWADARWIVLDRAEHWATGEGGAWNGPADLTARAAFAYDRTFLYMCVRTRDDMPGRVRAGAELWRGDSVQLAIDPLLQRTPGTWGFYDGEIGFSIPDPAGAGPPKSPELFAWHAPSGARSGFIPIGATASGRDGDEVLAEIAVPLAWYAPLSPFSDGLCGMAFIVNDSDGDNRKGFLQWASGIGIQKDPSRYGILRFDAPPAGELAPATGHWEARRVAAPIGTPFEATLTASAAREAAVTVRVQVRDSAGTRALADGAVAITLRAGRHRYPVRIDTGGLPHERLRIELEATSGPDVVARASLPAALYPPAGWEKGKGE